MNLIPESLQLVIIRILTPLVRILMRNGIAYGTFADIARKVYVDVGFEEAKRQGKKTTISNVSILTGINRKEVRRLRDHDEMDTGRSMKKFNRVVRVLAGWQLDESFLQDGQPKVLKMEDGEDSFTRLVRRYSGDMPVVAMFNALRDGGYIQRLEDGRIRLIKRSFMPQIDPEQKLDILGTDTAELIETIDHNLQISDPDDAWYQRKAWNIKVSRGSIPQLKKRIDRSAQSLLEQIDADFTRHETEQENDRCQVAVGIYFHMASDESEEDSVS